ncbi:MAG: isochorismatase family protein [Actinomycetota bacterium]|nr:isochorismatase family protein [Actinomycetota bacterium]
MDYDANTALVVVDVQNDFADPRGSLYVPEGDEVVDVVNDEIERARAAGTMIVYTQDWHPERTPHFESDGGIWPVHCVQGTWGADLHPDLNVVGDVIKKGTGGEDGYSGFTVRDPSSGAEADTSLEQSLRERGIEKIVVAGLATDYCVKETALDGIARGFDTIVLRDAVRAVDLKAGDGERALEAIASAGGRIEGAAR